MDGCSMCAALGAEVCSTCAQLIYEAEAGRSRLGTLVTCALVAVGASVVTGWVLDAVLR